MGRRANNGLVDWPGCTEIARRWFDDHPEEVTIHEFAEIMGWDVWLAHRILYALWSQNAVERIKEEEPSRLVWRRMYSRKEMPWWINPAQIAAAERLSHKIAGRKHVCDEMREQQDLPINVMPEPEPEWNGWMQLDIFSKP